MSWRSGGRALVAQLPGRRWATSASAQSSRVGGAGWTLGVIVALAVLAAPGVAPPQQPTTAPQRATAPSGIPGVWTITPYLQVGEKYTDNVFGTAHDHQSD